MGWLFEFTRIQTSNFGDPEISVLPKSKWLIQIQKTNIVQKSYLRVLKNLRRMTESANSVSSSHSNSTIDSTNIKPRVLTASNMKTDERNSGFTFVTVPPQGASESSTMRRLRTLQQVEKSQYKGASTQFIGRPGQSSPDSVSSFDAKCHQVLQDLQDELPSQPTLLSFQPVAESQLLRTGPPQNIYSKGNFLNQRNLLYRVFKTDARLVRSVLQTTGFSHTDSHDWNIMWLGSSAQQYLYEGLNEFQRINHFPSCSEVTRKDKLSLNILKMQERYGEEAFDFMPETYVLPSEFADFYSRFHELKHSRWIIKPSSSSQGRGIYIVDSITEVPMDDNCVVSKYIQNPLLINGLKFDLRLYVLITCFDPLKVYLYEEGLARFASEAYNPDSRKNRYAHLTNYSVNKKNDRFIQNQDHLQDDVGHKWSLSALFRYLEQAGVDVDFLWDRIYDMIIKTMISIEPMVLEGMRKSNLHRNNCFDLLGFDVLVDSALKPWLLEVNLCPSMATESPLDLHIKSGLVADSLNLIGLRAFDRKVESANKVKARLRARQGQRVNFKAVLRDALEENERRGRFLRIYPSPGVDHYNQFFSIARPLNRSLYNAMFKEVCGVELQTANQSFSIPKPLPQETKALKTLNQEPKQTTKEKLVITGDDVLMEYISRISANLNKLNTERLKSHWKRNIDKFIRHYVWHASDNSNLGLKQRLDCRISEMRERQRRLVASSREKGGSQDQKLEVLRGFSAQQLENMLCSSSKNIAQEVVGCLISADQRGVLTDMVREYRISSVSEELA